MGERNKKTEAIILQVKELGENNRSVTALSPEMGLFYLVLYGGPKSKLKSYVQTFNSGTLYFYDDEVKHSRKISDFDVKKTHLSFAENLYKLCAANLACEIVMKTKCGGDSHNAFRFLSAFLDGIDLSDENEAKLGTIRFLWRYLTLLGINPDIHTCSSCASSLLHSESTHYFERENGFVCKDCVSSLTDTDYRIAMDYQLNQNSSTYLAAVNDLAPSKVRELSVSEKEYAQMKNLCYHLISKACDTKLNSMEIGIGIL